MSETSPQETIIYASPLGLLELKASRKGLLWLKTGSGRESNAPDNPHLQQAVSWLDHFFAKRNHMKPYPALDLQGTAFQNRVWKLLLQIPYGESRSYKQIQQLYNSHYNALTSPRAIGAAIAANPIWIIVPCHRVIYANGRIGGYAGGVAMKLALQRLENFSLSKI